MGCGKEVPGELVEASGDASPILDPAEVVFDFVAAAIDSFWAAGLLSSIASVGDDGQRALVFDVLTDFLAVVSLVSADGEWRLGGVEHFFNDLTVMDLSAGDDEVQRPAFAVNDGVDFRTPAAAADADRLIFLPPFAPLAARCAFTMVLSMK